MMKHNLFYLFFSVLIILSINTFSQVEGPKRIIGKYSGKEKKGLAHGKGKAVGTDIYEGSFKKGYPHGEGTYIFGDVLVKGDTLYEKGDKFIGSFKKGLFDGEGKIIYNDKNKETKTGYWADGNYIGLTKDGYAVLIEKNIQRVECRYYGMAKNDIFIRGLVNIVEVGHTNTSFNGVSSYTNIPLLNYPFVLHIKGTIESTGARVELKVLLEKPGTWTIIVTGDDIL